MDFNKKILIKYTNLKIFVNFGTIDSVFVEV